jgi:hypothetical protein
MSKETQIANTTARLGISATILAAGLLFVSSYTAKAQEVLDVDVALVLLSDTSHSLDDTELRLAKDSHVEAFRNADVIRAVEKGFLGRVAVTYVEFSETAVQRVGWMVIDGPDSAAHFADAVAAVGAPHEHSLTDIAAGLTMAKDLIGKHNTSFIGSFFGDVSPVRDELVARGIQINALPMVLGPSEPDLGHYYETNVTGGPGGFSMPIHNIEDLRPALVRKLILELF